VRENRFLVWRTLPILEHQPGLDKDISVANLLAGKPSEESQASLQRWLQQRSVAKE